MQLKVSTRRPEIAFYVIRRWSFESSGILHNVYWQNICRHLEAKTCLRLQGQTVEATALWYETCWGNWRVSFTGTFERERKCISGFLFLGPIGNSELSLGAIWNFSKERGCPELIADYEAQKVPLIRPTFIGTFRARTQMLISQSINQINKQRCGNFKSRMIRSRWVTKALLYCCFWRTGT